jgi:hypothetical protein
MTSSIRDSLEYILRPGVGMTVANDADGKKEIRLLRAYNDRLNAQSKRRIMQQC